MKKVIYVIPGLNPLYKDGASNRVNSYANCFLQNDYKVYIISLCHIRQFRDVYRKKKTLRDDVTWILFPHLFYLDNRYKNLWGIVEKIFIFCIALFTKCKFVLCDYAVGAELSSWTRFIAKLIVNHRGDSIDELKTITACNDDDKRIKNLIYFLTKSVKIADYSIVVSENLRINIEQYTKLKLKNCFVFPCCADINRFASLQLSNNDDKIILGYFGGLNKWQCIDETLNLVKKLKNIDNRVYFLMLTNSSWDKYHDKLKELGSDSYGVESVSFNDIPQWISKMTLSFALRKNLPLNVVSSPTKLSESLAAGVPVVVTKATGDWRDIIEDGINGIVLDNLNFSDEDVWKIYNYIMLIHKNRKQYFDLCRDSISQRTWKYYSNKLIDFLER